MRKVGTISPVSLDRRLTHHDVEVSRQLVALFSFTCSIGQWVRAHKHLFGGRLVMCSTGLEECIAVCTSTRTDDAHSGPSPCIPAL